MTRTDLISSTPETLLHNIQCQLVDRIWLGMFLLCAIGLPTSVARVASTGWLPIYNFHIFVSLFVTTIYLLRKRLPFRMKALIALSLFYIFGTVSVLTLGFLGAGFWWLLFSSLLASTIYSHRLGLIIAVSALIIVILAANGFVKGYIILPFDANAYLKSSASWISFISVVLMMPLVMFQPIASFQRSTVALLKEVNRQRAEIERLATHDELTGLPSLNLAKDRLQMALNCAQRSQKKVALMFIDLDGFKTINDTHGHEAGDKVLIETSKRLVKLSRNEDTAARIGGDEFILILGNLASDSDAALVAERMIKEISQPINFFDISMSVGASIGIAIFPDHASDAQSLRRLADEAMYAVKRHGKNQFAFAAMEVGV